MYIVLIQIQNPHLNGFFFFLSWRVIEMGKEKEEKAKCFILGPEPDLEACCTRAFFPNPGCIVTQPNYQTGDINTQWL